MRASVQPAYALLARLLAAQEPLAPTALGVCEREFVRTTKGEAFDLKAVHRAVLSHGSLPLELLKRVVASDLGLPWALGAHQVGTARHGARLLPLVTWSIRKWEGG